MTGPNAAPTGDGVEFVPAKRGDLAVLTISVPTGRLDGSRELAYLIEVITSVTRDGQMKATRPANAIRPLLLGHRGIKAHRVVPAVEVDVAAGLADVESHTWPGSTRVRPYDDMTEVRALLARHTTTAQEES